MEQIPERLARAEAHLSTIGPAMAEIKQLLLDLGRRLEQNYVPRSELDQRFAGVDDRLRRLEARGQTVPPWVGIVGSLLIGLVSLLGGTLVGTFLHK